MGVIGISAKLQYGSTPTAVPGVKSVSFPAFTVGAVDTTNLGNLNFGKTYMPGMIDAGSVSFECAYTEATYTALHGLIRTHTPWKVSAPEGEDLEVNFGGFLTSLNVTYSNTDDEANITGEIKVSGIPTLA